MAAAPLAPRRGIATVDDLRARSTIDPVTRCWHYTGARRDGHPRIWTADLDAMDKRVLAGPRAVWYIAHGTPLGSLVAYMACMTADCVCPVHVRKGSRADLNALMSRHGLLSTRSAAKAAAAAKGRAAAGHRDTPEAVVLAVRAAKGTASAERIGLALGVSKSVAARILRGETFRHLLPAGQGAAPCAR